MSTLKDLGFQYAYTLQNLDYTGISTVVHSANIDTTTFTTTAPNVPTTYITKETRLFTDLFVATEITCPLFIGLATHAQIADWANAAPCCDYVFDQYFDKKCEISNYKILTIDETFEFVKVNRHLPTIKTNRSNFDKNKLPIGEMISNLWETVEIQAIYIKELSDRIKVLEEKVNSQTL